MPNDFICCTTHYIRQYNTSGAVVRTLTLLDANGLTIVPTSLNLVNANTRLSQGIGYALRVTTPRGYVDVGAQNSGWAHFQTDRDKFHFSRPVAVVGDIYAGPNYNQKVWHAGNDGAGSGLDADLLDGRQSALYMSFQRLNIDANNYTSIGVWESNTATNMPTPNVWHQLMSWGTGNGNFAFQMANTYTADGYLYFRHKIADSWKNWRIVMDRHDICSKADYQHVVILLWRDKEQLTHQVIGKIYTQNAGSARFQLADLNLWHSRWGSLDSQENTQCHIDTTGYPAVGYTLVTCTYNGEKWWALRHTNDQAAYFYFQGYASRNVSFEKIVYYTSNTSTVNNSEIYNSIVDQSNDLIRLYSGGYRYMLSRDVYDKSEADSRFVNVTGDTMSGSLIVYGDIYSKRNMVAYGEVTAYSTSDIRLKKNIKPINNPFAILKRSQPVLFEWNEKAFEFNKEKEKGIVPGLIAQWEQAILPVAIHTMYEEYLGINYENYIPYLIAGINEHEDEIQRLKTKVKELEDKLASCVA